MHCIFEAEIERKDFMKKRRSSILLRYGTSLVIMLSLLGVAAGVLVLQHQESTFAHGVKIQVNQKLQKRSFTLQLSHPTYWMAGNAAMGMQLACQAITAPQHCFTPQEIQRAYGASPLYQRGISGRGRSIVIVDAFQSPTLLHDLHLFDRIFALPDPLLHVFAPDGLVPFNQQDAAQVSWAAEITLDVEWAHAIAPDATINLVLTNPLAGNIATFSDFLLSMVSATKFAIDNNLGDVISQSFGGNEICATPAALQAQHAVFQAAAAKKITLVASSGDRGSAEVNCAATNLIKGVSTPASDPLVTAVGGTTLATTANTGFYLKESGWSGSGGGFSTMFAKPAYQQGIAAIGTGRGLPDVAYNANPKSGVLVIWSSSGQGADRAVVFGGTSAGAPQWAGITALLNQTLQGRFGQLNNALYRLGRSTLADYVFHDIVTGSNTFQGKDLNGAALRVQGFMAAQGWDAVTGLGTPNIARLIAFLPQFA
jgi:subtilase family serine protease